MSALVRVPPSLNDTMIVKTTAITLRVIPYSNTSHIVTWLTPDFGRVSTMIKGAQRPKSRFLGQYDLFYTCELLFYGRRHGDLYTTRECSPVKTRDRFRYDWRAMAMASYMTDMITRICWSEPAQIELFGLLDYCLDDMDIHGSSRLFLYWFELKLLEYLGFRPRLRECLKCHAPLIPGAERTRFCYMHGGILCEPCSGKINERVQPIPPDVWAILFAWQKTDRSHFTRTTKITDRQRDLIEKLLGRFLSYHLELSLRNRNIALDLLSRKTEKPIGLHPEP